MIYIVQLRITCLALQKPWVYPPTLHRTDVMVYAYNLSNREVRLSLEFQAQQVLMKSGKVFLSMLSALASFQHSTRQTDMF